MAYPQHVHPQVAQGIQMMYSGATPMSPINPGIGNVCPDDMPSYKMTTNPRGLIYVIVKIEAIITHKFRTVQYY